MTNQNGEINLVRKGDGSVFAVTERKLGVQINRSCLELISPVQHSRCLDIPSLEVQPDGDPATAPLVGNSHRGRELPKLLTATQL